MIGCSCHLTYKQDAAGRREAPSVAAPFVRVGRVVVRPSLLTLWFSHICFRQVCAASVAAALGIATVQASQDAGVPSAARRTTAVMPFTNISGAAADEWIGAGIAETLASDLQGRPGIAILDPDVVRRAASGADAQVVNEEVALGICRDLGTEWLVTGAYQRVGDLVRVTARLVNVMSGAVIRTVKLDGTLSEMFELQDEIAAGLSGDGAAFWTERVEDANGERLDEGLAGSAFDPAPDASTAGGEAARIARSIPSEDLIVPGPDPTASGSPSGGRNPGRALTPADVTGSLGLGAESVPRVISGSTVAAGLGPVGSGPAVVPARVGEGPTIDGRLDDEAWRGAVRLTDFVQMNPLEGAPASEDTEVYLAYDGNNFYVGVHAHYSDAGSIRANRVERDQTIRDDKLTLYFDPFMDQQRAYVFSVNGYGVQGDATLDSSGRAGGRRREGPGGGGGRGRDLPGVIPPGDTSWDALFASAGGLVEDGWTAEMAIPFKSLRYPSRGGDQRHRWGFQIVRNIESKDERAVWSPVSRGVTGFLTQMGTLDGMANLSTSRNLEFLPTVTAIQAGGIDPSRGGFVEDDFFGEAGLNVKYGITSNLTADFTVNPDFSQIESDQPQIEVNQRFPLFFSELRPFFLEGQEIFNPVSPTTLVHTRTIVDPRFGAKLTGKVGRSALGVLVADDAAPGKRDDPTDPAFGKTAQAFVGRYRYDLYGGSHIGTLVTDREFMDGYNRVGALDAQLRLGGTNRWNLAIAKALTREESGQELSGSVFGTAFRHTGRNLSYSAFGVTIGPGFRNQSGFVRRVDERRVSGNVAYRWWPESWLINWGPRTNYQRNYDFAGTLQDEVAGTGLDFAFARSITAGVGADRVLERFGGIDFWKWNYSTTFNVNTSGRVSVEGELDWGDGIFFSDNPFLGRSVGGRILSSVRPFSRLQADISLDFSHLHDPRTATEVFDVKIYRTFTTYQVTERFLFRNIMEYNTFDRTLDANLLFTYRVNAGTVLFVGYDDHYRQGDFIDFGETLAERFLLTDKLQRTNRALFTKFSYLFRY